MNAPTPTETTVSDSDSLTVAIVSAVAESKGVSTTDLPPLYDAIDLDALSALFAPTSGEDRAHGTASFEYADCGIEFHADGTVAVSPLETADATPSPARAD